MPADTITYSAVFKDKYGPKIQTQINNRTKALNRMKRMDAKKWGGGRVLYPIKVGRNNSLVAGGEGMAMPAAGQQQHNVFDIPMASLYGACQWTDEVLERSEGSEQAFVSAMESEMSGLVDDAAVDMNRMFWGAGRGTLATITTGANSATQTVRDPLGVTGAANGSRYLNKNDILAVISAAVGSSTVRGAQRVTNVPVAGTSVVFAAAINTTTGDLVVRAGATGAIAIGQTAADKEPVGVLALIDDSTYAATISGLSRTQEPLLRSTVITDVGVLSGDVIQRLLDVLDQTGEATITDLWGHHSVRRAYLTITENDRRYSGADLKNPDAGTRAAKQQSVTFGDIPFEVDRHAPYGVLTAPCWDYLMRFVLSEGHWDQRSGNILKQVVNASGQWTANYAAYWCIKYNLHNQRPNASGRLDGITSETVNVHLY